MKIKCCNKFRKPKIEFSANMSDFIGLSVFLCIMLTMVGFLVYGVGEAVLEGVSSGSSAKDIHSCYENSTGRRRLGGCVVTSGIFLSIVFLSAVIYILPKFLNACGYLINYRLSVKSYCPVCNSQEVICDLPKIPTDPN
jgi:hypothetical protein